MSRDLAALVEAYKAARTTWYELPQRLGENDPDVTDAHADMSEAFNAIVQHVVAVQLESDKARLALHAMSQGQDADVDAIIAMAVHLVDNEHARVLLRHVVAQSQRLKAVHEVEQRLETAQAIVEDHRMARDLAVSQRNEAVQQLDALRTSAWNFVQLLASVAGDTMDMETRAQLDAAARALAERP